MFYELKKKKPGCVTVSPDLTLCQLTLSAGIRECSLCANTSDQKSPKYAVLLVNFDETKFPRNSSGDSDVSFYYYSLWLT